MFNHLIIYELFFLCGVWIILRMCVCLRKQYIRQILPDLK